MQDIERTTRGILKKFEAPEDYDKIKIVFLVRQGQNS